MKLQVRERFVDAAKTIGADVQYRAVEGAVHSFHLEPPQADLKADVIGFFDHHVKVPACQ